MILLLTKGEAAAIDRSKGNLRRAEYLRERVLELHGLGSAEDTLGVKSEHRRSLMKDPITVWLYVNAVVKNGDGYDVRLLPAKTEPTFPLPEVHVHMPSVDGLSERWILTLQPSSAD